MGLCDLPNDILFMVVRRACAYLDEGRVLPARHKLPLLAVCRRLRGVSLPVVYDTIYEAVYDAEHEKHRRHTRLYTNLVLVLSVGCLHLVRRVDIELGLMASPLQDFSSTVGRLRAASEQWDAVHTLGVYLNVILDRHMDLSAIVRSAQEITAALTATFPRVQQLYIGNRALNTAVDRFAGCIAAHYAGQLRALHSDQAVARQHAVVFRGLRDANIGYTPRRHRELPQIDPAELRCLKLPGWPANHPWAAFSADGDVFQNIRFPCLQVLDLSGYQKGTAGWIDGARRKWSLHFPVLRVLKVACKDDVPHVLRHGVFPARMDQVVVVATTLALPGISDMTLPSARRFQLITQGDLSADPTAPAAVKRMLDNVRGCDEVELKTSGRELPMQPETILSTSLTRLEATMEIDVDTMVEFIRCLPRLSSLGIMSLNPHSTRLDISVPEPGAGRLVEPISNMLKSVSIAFRCNDQNHTNPAVLALKYLLLAVPSLSSISAHGIPDDSMDGFIDAYADQYLHLARLRIHIYERRRWG